MGDDKIRWAGEHYEAQLENGLLLWFSRATFHRHVAAVLAACGVTRPTGAQYVQVFKHCQKLSYWQAVRDPSVHLQRTTR